MRFSTVNKPVFVKNKRGKNAKFLGVCFGYDIATEHECGIAPIMRSFGTLSTKHLKSGLFAKSDFEIWQDAKKSRGLISRVLMPETPFPPMGIEKRRVISIPETFEWVKTKDGREGFAFSPHYHVSERIDEIVGRSYRAKEQDLLAAWSDRDFLIVARDPKSIKRLRQLYEAIVSGNAMFCGVKDFFVPMEVVDGETPSPAGLCVVDLSAYPTCRAKELHDQDMEKFDSEKRLHDTGIKDLLRERGKKYMALCRYHESDDGTWIAWLNPWDNGVDGEHDAGWYTIEELREWAEDRGPVMRKRR